MTDKVHANNRDSAEAERKKSVRHSTHTDGSEAQAKKATVSKHARGIASS